MQLTSEMYKILVLSLLMAFVILHKKTRAVSVQGAKSTPTLWIGTAFSLTRQEGLLFGYHEDKGDGYSFSK